MHSSFTRFNRRLSTNEVFVAWLSGPTGPRNIGNGDSDPDDPAGLIVDAIRHPAADRIGRPLARYISRMLTTDRVNDRLNRSDQSPAWPAGRGTHREQSRQGAPAWGITAGLCRSHQ